MAPVILNPQAGPMTDEEFVAFCEQYPDCSVEVSAEGEILIMPPAYSKTGIRNSAVIAQLFMWAESEGSGEVFDSSAGFVLPNGARRSPDAAWIRKDRIAALPQSQQDRFYRLCPDFLIELRSANDRLRKLLAKMEEYIANGAALAWLIDPVERKVRIYRPGREPEILEAPERITADGPVAGFILDLKKIWE